MTDEIKVFISYAREDYDTAKRLYDDLKKETGIKPWMDKVDILIGEDWEFKIRQAVGECSYFIALISENSVSKKGYVQKELKLALETLELVPPADIFVLPIRLDESMPIHEKLRKRHWGDLFPSYEEGFNEILRVFKTVQRTQVAKKPIAKTKPQPVPEQDIEKIPIETVEDKPPQRRIDRKPIIFLLLIAVLSGVAIFYFFQFEPDQSKVSFRVETNPEGAAVFVNGEKKGISPVSLDGFQPGGIYIRLEKEGYETLKKTIEIRSGTELLNFDLSRLSKSSLTITDPPGAIVYLNGKKMGAVPLTLTDLEPGEIYIRIEKDKYEPEEKVFNILPNSSKSEGFQLKPKRKKNSLEMEFVYIPPGTFKMGSPDNEPERRNDETLHNVTLTADFYMQTTEVTVGQWKAFVKDASYKSEMETGDGAYGWNGENWEKKKEYYWGNPGFKQTDDHPVTCVSWNDAMAFVAWLNKKEDGQYRLPTEAEWEYACRAGTDTPFSFGKCLSTDQANYNGYYPLEDCPKGQFRQGTTPVGTFARNAWGLYDMHGNVWEWCADWYGPYPEKAEADPTGPATGTRGIFRGGGLTGNSGSCRSAVRYGNSHGYRDSDLGFRLARSRGQQ